jgi:hypothetical protein
MSCALADYPGPSLKNIAVYRTVYWPCVDEGFDFGLFCDSARSGAASNSIRRVAVAGQSATRQLPSSLKPLRLSALGGAARRPANHAMLAIAERLRGGKPVLF